MRIFRIEATEKHDVDTVQYVAAESLEAARERAAANNWSDAPEIIEAEPTHQETTSRYVFDVIETDADTDVELRAAIAQESGATRAAFDAALRDMDADPIGDEEDQGDTFTAAEIVAAFEGLFEIADAGDPSEWLDEDAAEHAKARDFLKRIKATLPAKTKGDA